MLDTFLLSLILLISLLEYTSTHFFLVKILLKILLFQDTFREFPGGPVVRTQRSHCQGPGFGPWSGN